jgi:hypothetical protein
MALAQQTATGKAAPVHEARKVDGDTAEAGDVGADRVGLLLTGQPDPQSLRGLGEQAGALLLPPPQRQQQRAVGVEPVAIAGDVGPALGDARPVRKPPWHRRAP